jgi:hypothetical protein
MARHNCGLSRTPIITRFSSSCRSGLCDRTGVIRVIAASPPPINPFNEALKERGSLGLAMAGCVVALAYEGGLRQSLVTAYVSAPVISSYDVAASHRPGAPLRTRRSYDFATSALTGRAPNPQETNERL